MAVPSSGELELRGDIALEVYGSATGNNISLGTMSDLVGFASPDAMTDFYGYSSAVAPSVTTNSNSSVGTTTMYANGNVTSDGGGTITQRGFYFGTSSNYASNTKYSVAGTTGSYNRYFTGLNSGTTYYSTAYAINSAGETRGSTVNSATSVPQLGNMSFVVSAPTGGTGTTGSNNINISVSFNVTNNNSFAVTGYQVWSVFGGAFWVQAPMYNDSGSWPSYDTPPFNGNTGGTTNGGTMAAGEFCEFLNHSWRIGAPSVGGGGSMVLQASASGYTSLSYGTITLYRT